MKKIKSFFGKVFNFKKDGKVNVAKSVSFVVALVVLITVVTIVAFGGSGNQEKKLNAKLEELGTSFYEEFYYDQLGDTQEEKEAVLKKFTDKGIKIDLDNLLRLNSESSDEIKALFVNKKTGSSCDSKNTKVIMYPKEKYGKKDYKLETKLVCGFDKNEEKVETIK